ncbi:MAG: carbohydrate binding domain-containing protein [Candidatus Zipacnadales bacterium]
MERLLMSWLLLLPTGLALGLGCRSSQAQEEDLFPFTIPWDDDSPSVANVSDWNEKPAGKHGFITVRDGHFVDGKGERIRFLGTNLCFAAAFPPHEIAEKVARRMAKFGINIVRFHHMDSNPFPRGILDPEYADKQHLSKEAFDRLDYLIYQLKENGIYANLNLHVSRKLTEADGIQQANEMPQMDKGVDNFHPRMIELQRNYARELLTHVNPYTGKAYAEEPCVAMIEINNENSLTSSWRGGSIDRLPQYLQELLDERWQEWLRNRYANSETLERAWNEGAEPMRDEELLLNGSFSEGMEAWHLEIHEPAQATLTVLPEGPDESPAARIEITSLSDISWHVQFHQSGLAFREGAAYTLSFWAKANPERRMGVNNFRAHEPWGTLGFSTECNLTPEWQRFEFTFRSSETEEHGRITFTGLGSTTGTVWLADISLRPGGIVGLRPEESLEQGTISRPRYGEMGGLSVSRARDYVTFLLDLETEYWTGMYQFLKREIGVKQPVTGTQMGYTPPQTHAALDYYDAHAYWHHPWFPNRPWDPNDWWVTNTPMTDSAGGTLTGLAGRRVAGKPYTISEYNHPAPMTTASEAFILSAAYGALQDWDGLFQFAYNHSDQWEIHRIPNFFDLKSHITQLVTFPAAAALFRRGDVRAADQMTTVFTNPQAIVERGVLNPASGGFATTYGVEATTALSHRVSVAVGKSEPHVEGPTTPLSSGEGIYEADTGELRWEYMGPGTGKVIINTLRSKALVGAVCGIEYDLAGIGMEIGATRQNWAAVTLTAMDAPDFKSAGRILVTATGYYENPGWGWETSGDRVTVRSNWGQEPSMAEGIPATITLPVSPARVKAYALDGRGQRASEVEVDGEAQARVHIGPQYKTLWYEVVIE